MIQQIASIVIVAVVGSLIVPIMMLALARVGLFEPIEFDFFGRRWSFIPRAHQSLSYAHGSVVIFPIRQTVFAGVVTSALTVPAAVHVYTPSSLMTTTAATGICRTL